MESDEGFLVIKKIDYAMGSKQVVVVYRVELEDIFYFATLPI